MYQYTHLIAEGKSKFSNSLKPYVVTHDVIDTIEAFHQLSFNYLTIPPIKIKTRPVLFILRRRENYKEFLPAIEGVVYDEIVSDIPEGSQEKEHRKERAPKEKIVEENEKNEIGDNEDYIEQSTENESQQKTETRTEESRATTDTIHEDVSSGNFDNVDQQNVNKKIYSTNSSSDKTDTDNVPEDTRKTKLLNKEIHSQDSEDSEVELRKNEEIQIDFPPKLSKKIAASTDKIHIEEKESAIKDDTDIQKTKKFRTTEKHLYEIKEKIPKEVNKKEFFSKEVSTVSYNEILDKDVLEPFVDNSKHHSYELLDKPMEKVNEAETVVVIEKKLKYRKLSEKLRKSKDVPLDKDNLTKGTLKKVTSKSADSDQEENEMTIFSPKNNKTTQNVKQTIRTIIQKYKKEKFNKEYYSQPKESHAKDTIKRIIDAEKIKEEKEEISKLEKQIMDLIENNEKIVNKNLIKAKIRETIRTELINAIDYQVDAEPEGKRKIEAKELPKRKIQKPKFVLPKKTIRKGPEQKISRPLVKETLPVEEELNVSEDFESLNISDENYLTGEEGIDSDSPVLAAFEDSLDFPTGKSVENSVLETQKLEFVKKFKKANEKLENIMTIIDEIVDTIEITDEEDLEYIR